MIDVYGLSYRRPEYVEKSLKSMLASASEQVNFTIIDNKTENSAEIFKFVKPLVDSGQVKRYIQVSKNDMLSSFNRAVTLFPPTRGEPFFILTELDLIVDPKIDWIAESRIMQTEAVMSGFKLSEINYVPPNKGHVDDGISVGFWLMGLRTETFYTLLSKVGHKLTPLQDYKLRSLMSSKGKLARSNSELYHLGWDLWKDDPEYFDRKLKGINWGERKQSPIEFIYEGKG